MVDVVGRLEETAKPVKHISDDENEEGFLRFCAEITFVSFTFWVGNGHPLRPVFMTKLHSFYVVGNVVF